MKPILSVLALFLSASICYGLTPMGADVVMTERLQQAIDSVHESGGGELSLAPGIYCTGMVRLKSNVNLHLGEDAVILGSINPYDYEGYSEGTVENVETNHFALIVAYDAKNISITGKGKIDGRKVHDTFRSAIAIESVDGAVIENIVVDSIEAVNTGNAIFIRLGHRHGEHPGSIRNVSISNLTCEVPFGRPDSNYDLRGPDINTIHNPFPASITGIPGHRVQDVSLSNIKVSYPG